MPPKCCSKQWYQRLSIMFWVMETMKIAEPYLRRPFTSCWQLHQPDFDPEEAKKHFEKTKKDLVLWKTIELQDVSFCSGHKYFRIISHMNFLLFIQR